MGGGGQGVGGGGGGCTAAHELPFNNVTLAAKVSAERKDGITKVAVHLGVWGAEVCALYRSPCVAVGPAIRMLPSNDVIASPRAQDQIDAHSPRYRGTSLIRSQPRL